MSTDYPLPSYIDIEEALQTLHIPLTAAECHGLVCGLYCTNNDIDSILQNLYAQSDDTDDAEPITDAARDDLRKLCQTTAHQFTDANFGFQLLLPIDEDKLAKRTVALGLWCQTFLSGLGEGNINLEHNFKEELQEIIHDLTEISKIDSASLNNDEEDEVNFIELVEFVRVSVLTIYSDLLLENKNVNENTTDTIH